MSERRTEDIVIGKNRVNLELRFSANAAVRHFITTHLSRLTISAQAESLRSSIQELEVLMKGIIPLMSRSVERTLGKAIHLGSVFVEVSPPIFGNQQDIDAL